MESTLAQTQARLDAEMAQLQKDMRRSYEVLRCKIASNLEEIKANQKPIACCMEPLPKVQDHEVRERFDATPLPGSIMENDAEDERLEDVVIASQISSKTRTVLRYVPPYFEKEEVEEIKNQEEEVKSDDDDDVVEKSTTRTKPPCYETTRFSIRGNVFSILTSISTLLFSTMGYGPSSPTDAPTILPRTSQTKSQKNGNTSTKV
ncbi:hypothetical protein EG328_002069 [Venturia inaequalis]|uniref:Uncharacterized protein n=1 Tax=Venturia inaequalis TaxID=5025 RepID=A0A8H3UW34_VENIN|nr:hypothetical protein EG328_002069 [Venturia inaequalis]KAE9989334.1 hypothetical protein EG327_002851 [Venturia inaequalis]RDI86065.1 hypothetical protein Vi05172_g4133 [Venturia inaequalis]